MNKHEHDYIRSTMTLGERAVATRRGEYLPQTGAESTEIATLNLLLGLSWALWRPFVNDQQRLSAADAWRPEVEAILKRLGSRR